MQSDNSKNNFFIQREHTHNLASVCFFLLSILLIFIILLISSISHVTPIIVTTAILLPFILLKLISQFRNIFIFNKLIKKVDSENIPFYITKSWNRKREASVWVGALSIIVISILLVITLAFLTSLSEADIIISLIIEIAILLSVVITMYLNIQLLDSYLKHSSRKLNMHSVEWMQIKLEHKIFYKTIFVWALHIIFVIPLLLMVIPKYRQAIYSIVKN